ncbi:MAG: alcohol dehydrogenase catalytic domain-containing protein [Halobacteriaceae archaeon]
MRAAAFTDLVGPSGVETVELPDPEPGPGEAVVEMRACSLNHHDLWILRGGSVMVDPSDLPFVSGLDLAGVVDEVGPDVTGVEPGDRVLLCPNETCGTCRYCREGPENLCANYSLYHGGFAERAAVEADRLVALPDGVDFETAAALPTAYMTAYRMLARADVEPGDTVFVPGAAGGVGVAAVQLAAVLGAESIATSSKAAKCDRLAGLGADHVVEAGDIEAVREAVESAGLVPDAAVNHLGGEWSALSLDLLARGGRMVVCGRTAGDVSEFDVAQLFRQHQHVRGSTMGTQTDLERVVDLVDRGAFDPPVGGTYPLDDADEAFAAMQERTAFGKLLLTRQ